MAIKYSELNKIDKRPLSEEELAMVSVIEKHIDDEILRQFKTKNEVWIDLCTANFEYNPINQERRTNMKSIRKKMMADELKRRYEEAEWTISYHVDDGTEGNLSGGDYMILKGNRV
jgi:hypothetical protein